MNGGVVGIGVGIIIFLGIPGREEMSHTFARGTVNGVEGIRLSPCVSMTEISGRETTRTGPATATATVSAKGIFGIGIEKEKEIEGTGAVTEIEIERERERESGIGIGIRIETGTGIEKGTGIDIDTKTGTGTIPIIEIETEIIMQTERDETTIETLAGIDNITMVPQR